MFLLLTQILLWLLLALIVYYLLLKLIPRAILGWFGTILLFLSIVIAFYNPNVRIVSSVWSLLSLPLKPLGLALVLLFMGATQIKKGDIKDAGLQLIWAAFFILLISSLPYVAYQLSQRVELNFFEMEKQRQEICTIGCPGGVVPLESQTARAIVLIGQGTTQANLPYRTQIQLTDTGDRIMYTAEIYRQQRALNNDPLVIVSAGPRPDLAGQENSINEANDIAKVMERMGVPANRISIEPRGVDLRTSAERVKEILQKEGLGDRIILITSALNIRRATLTFNQIGIKVIPRPTNFYTFQDGATPRRRLRLEDFIPSAEALVITTRLVEEYLTSIYYFLRGWLIPISF